MAAARSRVSSQSKVRNQRLRRLAPATQRNERLTHWEEILRKFFSPPLEASLSVIFYLLKPILKSIRRAFREE